MIESHLQIFLVCFGLAIILVPLSEVIMENFRRKQMASRLNSQTPEFLSLPLPRRSVLSFFMSFVGVADVSEIVSTAQRMKADFQRLRDMSRRDILIAFPICGALIFGLSLLFVTRSISVMILGNMVGAVFGFLFYRQYRFQLYSKSVLKSLPVAVDGLIRCLKAGFDLNRSLSIIRDEVAPELQFEFDLMLRNRDLGQSLGDAMYFMADRLQSREALFLASLVAVQERSGGPLVHALEALSQILKDRERLRLKRMVASAEARMSALILGGLPVVISTLLLSTNTSYRTILLETQSGRLALAFCITLLGIGTFVMYRLVRSPQA